MSEPSSGTSETRASVVIVVGDLTGRLLERPQHDVHTDRLVTLGLDRLDRG